MAKKKSKRFIIPAAHFAAVIIEEKLDIPKNSLIESEKERLNISQLNESTENYKTGKENDTEKTKAQNLEEKEIVKPERSNLKNNLPRKSALSLSSLKRNKREEEEKKLKNKQKVTNDNVDLPKDPFTEETFLKIWEEYIDSLHGNGEKIFASILKADTPKIKKNLICVVYPNEMMKAELIKVKSKALKYLRKKLNNFSVDFQVTVNEENTKRFAYTPEEKYELLKEKNKAISVLRKTFNLEL